MTKVKTKKRIFNAVMVVAAAVIVIAGVMMALDFKGTPAPATSAGSASAETADLVTCEKSGNVNIVRMGVGYALENDTKLKVGDQIETLSSSSMSLSYEGIIPVRMGVRTTAVVQKAADDFSLSMKQGTAAVWAKTQLGLTMCDDAVTVSPAENSLVLLSQEQGSASIYVLGGSVMCSGVEASAEAGKTITLLKAESGWEASVADLSEKALQDATIQAILTFEEEGADCIFSSDELNSIVEDREQARKQAQQKAVNSGMTSSDSSDANAGNQLPTCTIEIRCDTILNNMSDLTEGKESYVPSNGVILATSTVSFKEGDTVFDVLTAACKAAGIQLEYTFSTMYGSNYIEGINNLYEFDCGSESGWMYKVNEWFPNYGCSKYELHDGDVIVWCYTCKGLGADVGGDVY